MEDLQIYHILGYIDGFSQKDSVLNCHHLNHFYYLFYSFLFGVADLSFPLFPPQTNAIFLLLFSGNNILSIKEACI